MASLTLKGLPDDLLNRLRTLATEERRSLNQQTILLLEQALQQQRLSFTDAYESFRRTYGPSPLDEDDLSALRSSSAGRKVNL